ncbi:hemolysin [Bordetella ansorpii]|uniref:Hemolysin n=1 Tax=Bordetella ansorpii TaxID=288768 RepID=A0A157SN64_9BORD|nr:VCBS domain-containing protein [Bordetella ansorpii]SAI71918.1 hemolysin [Bordetella ansorpii]
MATSAPATVTAITGRAWIRHPDGSLTALHEGSKVPPNSEIVTASGATVTLQVENGMPVVIGAERLVGIHDDMIGPPADPGEAAVTPPTGPDSERLLAILQAGGDPFEELGPTAATLAGGGGGEGGSSIVRLAHILETTSPLALEYPNPARFDDFTPRADMSGIGGNAAEGTGDTGVTPTNPTVPSAPTTQAPAANRAPAATDDPVATTEKNTVRGNVLGNDTDPDGDRLTVTGVNGRAMESAGISLAGSNGGTFTLLPDGSYTFVPGSGFQHLGQGQTALTTVQYTITDGNGHATTAVLEVTVVGVNDAAAISGAIGSTVQEDATPSTQGKLTVADADTTDTHIWSVGNGGKGAYGALTIGADGQWIYNLDNASPAIQALGAGQTLTETFTVTVDDGHGGTASQLVTITIDGTNDAPKLSGELTGAVTEDGVQTAFGQLTSTDVDATDTHTYSVVGNATGAYGAFAVDASGKWIYTLDNGAAQPLKSGQSVTETYTVQVSDGHGGTDTQVVTITINGTDDGAVITPHTPGADAGTVREDASLAISGKLDVTDPDAGQAAFQPQANTQGAHGAFTIDAAGNWTYNLDNASLAVQALGAGASVSETFTVKSTDGATHDVTVTVLGTNDAPRLSGELTGSVTEDGVKLATGQLAATDVDTGDKLTYSVAGNAAGTYGAFSVDANGKWTYTLDNAAAQPLKAGQSVQETYTVQVSDGHGGTDTQTITVTINGADDGAVIAPHAPGADAGAVREDTTLTTGGKLDVTDPDAGQASFQAQTGAKGQYGTFSIDANGNWTYTLNNDSPAVQALGAGAAVNETFTVKSADGSTHDVTITVQGTNDLPRLSGELTGSVAEDGVKTATGQLAAADVDTSDIHTYAVVGNATGTYGTLAIDASTGRWTYTLDNTAAQPLKSGQSVQETYTVQVSDGQGGSDTRTITVTINGADDGAVIAPHTPGADAGAVREDTTLTTGGKLDITDADAGQAVFQPQTGTPGQHGTFAIDGNGNWTYSLNNADPAVQALGAGQSMAETFTVRSADGATHDVTVTIQGTNDAPRLSGVLTGSVTEDGVKTATGTLAGTDVDTGDKLSYTVVGKATGAYGAFSVDPNTGKWTYTLDNAAAQPLKAGQSVTETYTVQVSDDHGGTDAKLVSITINGADDGAVIAPHAPGADAGAVREDGTLTTGGKLDVTDPDADQAVFQPQANTQGAHGAFAIDANGNWTYALNNAGPAVQALGAGQSMTETFTVRSADGATHDVTVTIQGTNDAPRLSGTLTGSVTEDGVKTATGQLSATDVDTSDTHTYSVVGSAKGTYGAFSVDPNTGKWTYTLDNSAAQVLKSGQAVTESYTVQVSDGHGGTDTKTVVVTINGTDDGAAIAPHTPDADAGTVREDGTLTTGGKLDVTDPDAGQAAFQAQAGTKGAYGTFAIDANGNWTYDLSNASPAVQALGAGASVTETFTVKSADGSAHDVTVTIQGTNDAPVLSGQQTGSVTEDGVKTATGQMAATDVDTGDKLSYAVVGSAKGAYGAFSIDANGKWTYTLDNAAAQPLKAGQSVTETYTVQVSDGHGGTDAKVITVTINGTDDAAIITPHAPGADTGAVREDGTLTAGGKLDVTDPDAGQAIFQAQASTPGAHGTFAIDASGNWTYSLDNADPAVQALGAGKTMTETFTVKSADGGTHDVTVTIQGTNDAPKLSGELTGSVTEDGVKTATGQLVTTDVDTTDTHTYSVVGNASGTYGAFSVDANGRWTYTLDNAAAQGLVSGQSVQETYTVQVSDGQGGTDTKTVSVTINGTDDAAIITSHVPGADLGAVREGGTLATGGKLDVVDPDAGQAVFQAQPNTQGAHGTFTIDANGNWTYNLNNADPAVQALGADKSMSETFTVKSADGSTHDVTVTIQGTNDAPKLTGDVTGSVTEDGVKTATGTLTGTDIDAGDKLTYAVTGAAKGTYGAFTVDPNTGKWTYTLDNTAAQALKSGQSITETYTVQVSDGQGGTDTKTVSVTINGTEDTAVITPQTPGADLGTVKEDGTLTTGGKLDMADPDAGQAVFQAQAGTQGAHGTFAIDANGNWTYNLNNADPAVQALGAGKTMTETFTVRSADGSTHDVTVTIQGTNDAPRLSGELTGSVTEDGVKTATGQLTTADVDTTDAHNYSVVGNASSPYGAFSVDANTGKWTYTLDNSSAQALTSGQSVQETYTVQVSDGHGGTDTRTITVTINGTDDGAVIAPHTPGADLGTVTEDGTLTTSGKLDVADPDAGQAVFQPQAGTQGQHGSFTIDSNGNWIYSLNNADPAVQALAAGQSMSETFTVKSADGTSHGVTVTIQGTNDAPKLSGELTGSVTEDGVKTATGQLTTTDVDTTDTHTYSVVGNANGTYGAFTVDASGKWTYTLDNAAAQRLVPGQSVQETYTVQVSDGHGGTDFKTISVTINGADDGAVIAPHTPGADTGFVAEGAQATGGKLDVTDPDLGQAVFQAQTGTQGAHGSFSIDANGNWTYALNSGDAAVRALGANESIAETFTVKSADGSMHDITVTVQGTNDAPVLSGELTGSVTEDGVKTATGQLATADADTTDTHTYSVVGNASGTYGAFTVDANTGKWIYTLDNNAAQALTSGQSITETYTVQVSDGQGGTDTKTISVTINGTDDTAVITARTPGADTGAVKEDGALTTGGKLDVTDPDAGQAVFQTQTGTQGAHGTFAVDANGNWTYTLNNAEPAVQTLAAGQSMTETFTVQSADGTRHDVTVAIQGTNDAPRLSGEITGSVTEDGVKTATGQLATADADTTDTHTYTVVGGAAGTYGAFAVDPDTGEWTYTLDNNAAQALKGGESVTETYTVQVSDGQGGTDSRTVTVTINGTDDGAIIAPHAPGADAGTVAEGAQTASGKLDISDPDAGQASFQVQTGTPGQHGSFSVDANGNWTYALNSGDAAVRALGANQSLTETFTVKAADGSTHDITVTIQGTNDAPVLSGDVTGSVTEDGVKTATGQLTTTDVDTTDAHIYSVVGNANGTYGTFTVDANGKWTYTLDNSAAQVLKSGQSVTETYAVQVSDGHGGTDTQTINVTINGTDDTAVLTAHTPGADLGTVKEDGTQATGGKLDVADPDAGQAVFRAQTGTPGAHGTFAIDANGNWTYNLNNADPAVQALGANQSLTETFTVKSADGTSHDVTVTIQGTNDAPVLSGEVTGSVTEDGVKTASGQLVATDVDTTDTHTYAVIGSATGAYGAFSVDANGKWTYTLDNDAAQALKGGERVTETYTVQVSDGQGGTDTKTISVTINGTDDAAIITAHTPGADAGTVAEGAQTASGKLDITDPDAGQASFQAQTGTQGAHGSFSIDASGNWTYALNSGDAAVRALGANQTLTETFTVKAADGSTHDVTVTIKGTNDAPELSGELTGSVTEDGVKTATGQLTTADVDTTDTHTYTVVGNTTGTYGAFAVDASTGRWTYTLDDSAAQVLKSGQSVTESYTVQVSDGQGGTDTRTISVTINGTDDTAVITAHTPGADAGTVGEDGTLAAGGKLDLIDPDAGQAVFQTQTGTQGAHGTFTIDANGNWTYNLNNADPVVQALAANQSLTETFTVKSADGTMHDVTVTIQGTNDAPKLSGDVTGSVTEDGVKTATGQLTTTDVDTTDTHTYSVVGNAAGAYGAITVDATTGKWTYTLDNAAAQSLVAGQAVTETYTVQVSDGQGGTDTRTITVTINGTDDGAIIAPSAPGTDAATVTEGAQTASGKLDITDPDAGQASFQVQTGTPGQHGSFSVDANGNWTYNLNSGDVAVRALGANQSLTETFTVKSADGSTHDITVTIQGTNDTPTLSGDLTGSVTEDGVKTATGQLTTTDADTTDTHTYTVVGSTAGTYGAFAVDPDTGKWTYTLDNNAAQVLKAGQSVTETYTVQVSDGQGGTDTKTITVTLNGTDDGAVITPHAPGADAGTVAEGAQTAIGKLDISDPDAGQASFHAQAGTAGAHGTFAVDANGNWTYALNSGDAAVRALGTNETLTETFTVKSADGSTHDITVTIQGTNDTPMLSGDVTGSVTEDGVKTATGQLVTADADTTDAHTYSVVGSATGNYGAFAVDPNTGKWTYTLDNNAAQGLTTGQSVTEIYTVQVSDGHGGTDTKTISVTINGSDDAAIITAHIPGADAATVTEGSQTASGKLDVTDPDAGQAVFQVQSGIQGAHGTFNLDASGNWTYALNNGDAAVRARWAPARR